MTEAEYWLKLEYRLCREFYGLPQNQFRGLWCDGFMPEVFEIGPEGPRITGGVWLEGRRKQQNRWRFQLILAKGVASREQLNWSDYLPADDVTGWLSVDWTRQLLTLRPKAAYPDRNPETP